MRRRLRLLLVPVLALALPLVALAAIGYQWLTLDREAAARRTKDAAEAQAVRLRAALLTRMAEAAAAADRDWHAADPAWPFARRPRPHLLIIEAYRFAPGGRLDEPDYDAAYQRVLRAGVLAADASSAPGGIDGGDTVRRTRLALDLLDEGRRALVTMRPAAAVQAARQLLDCCAAARDEFGVSLAVLAARQMTAAWRRQGVLAENLPGVIARLVDLVERGAIGHPNDVIDVAGFIQAAGGAPAGEPLLARIREASAEVSRTIATAQRLSAWLAASGRRAPTGPAFDAVPIALEGRDVVAGRYTRPAGGTVIVIFDTAALGSAVASIQQEAGFEGALVLNTAALEGQPAAHVPLVAGLPDLRIAVRARPGDAVAQERRTLLFTAAFIAALALTLAVAYLGFRDVAREVHLAAQQASFVASVSHELKTPVASIRLLAETLRMMPSADAAGAAPLLDEIREQAERQSRLIDNVLGVARIDRGLPMYQPAHVDLVKAADRSLERLDYLLRQEGFTVLRVFPDEPLYVSADPDGLLQAITNLVTNAVKYSGRCREIRVEADRAGGCAVLRVVDGGIGIEPAEQSRIFDRFYRAPSAARETGGTGLGLALVRHFAESHGGSVAVESTPGRGSTFTLRLPALSDDARGARLDQ